MNKQQIKGSVLLLITASIWGSAFVAQSKAMEFIQPFTLQAVRSIMAFVFLISVIFILDAPKKKSSIYSKMSKKDTQNLLLGGTVCGIILSVAANLQQIGMNLGVEPGKAGFITAMYLLLVPLFSVFIGKKIPVKMWFCAFAGIVGLYFLCINESLSFFLGDLLVILCSVAFTFHILAVDHFVKICDGVKLSCVQFFVVAVISSVFMFAFEQPSLQAIKEAAFPILYAGVGSCGIAYTLQIVGQRYTPPVIASLLMSLESVFAVITQLVVMGTVPTPRESIGCIVMFAAIIFSQIPDISFRKNYKL